MKLWLFILLVLVSAVLIVSNGHAWVPPQAGEEPRVLLRDDWTLESSAKVPESGDKVSDPQFHPQGWFSCSVPATVFAALLQSHLYPDPYFGMNLRSVPGTTYPIGENFSNLPMPEDSPFRSSWWYRREFKVPAKFQRQTLWLHFDGINFRANIWLNGRQVASSTNVAGPFRLYEFDISKLVHPSNVNVLAVEVFPPQPDDLGITWTDDNPAPPDKEMGIWREVYLTASGPVALRFPNVFSRLDFPSLETAHLTVSAEVHNVSEHSVQGILKGRIEGVGFEQPVGLAPGEKRVVTFTPDHFLQLNLNHPRLWWPYQLGPQTLHTLDLAFAIGGENSDSQSVSFGIRQVTSLLDADGHRVFSVNGTRFLVRGAGWWPDMLLRFSPERQETELRYVRDMNLNVLRMDGKLEDENFLNLADRYGILLMPGWCCCDHWERWKTWKDEDYAIAAESLRDQIRRFRFHAASFDWLYGDDNPPPPRVEEMYLKIIRELEWPNPYQSSATAKPTTGAEPTGLKMTGPYEYVPPCYWLQDKSHGGAFGFLTEGSPGPSIPRIESLVKFLPKDHLWPIDEFWNYHAGGTPFQDLRVFTEAMNARYGEATGVEDYALKAQLMSYEDERAMYEAYGRNKYATTGILREMLNMPWPSMIWTLYDYYLRPGGSYFGAKKALEPLHIQYSYDDQSIVVVNSRYDEVAGLRAIAKVFNLDLSEKFSQTVRITVPPDSSNRVLVIPRLDGLTTTYFVWLRLEDSNNRLLSTNLYWLSTKPDVLNYSHSTWWYTPTYSFGDLTGLATLSKVNLNLISHAEARGNEGVTSVTVENPTQTLAFFVHLQVKKGREGDEVLPVLWEDNYFALMPGEKREIRATYHVTDLAGASPVTGVDGWNVIPTVQ